MDKKNIERKKELKAAIFEILGKDDVILKLAVNVINLLAKRRKENYRDSACEIWQEALKKQGVKLAKDCRIDKIVEVFPLGFNEIKQVVQNIKTKKESKPLNYEGLRKYAIEVLGDNVLKARKAVALRKKPPLLQAQLEGKMTAEELRQKQALEDTSERLKCENSFWCSLISDYSNLRFCSQEVYKPCLVPHAEIQLFGEEVICGEPYLCGLQFIRNGPELPKFDRCPGNFDPIRIK
jgi:hypothetical protein